MAGEFPVVRPRRLRRTAALRRLTAQTSLEPRHLVLPMFVREGAADPVPITSMPGVFAHSLDSLRKAACDAVEAGVGGLMLFGVPVSKDAHGSGADDPAGILNVAVHVLAGEVGADTVLMTDLCLDEFTDHGHCGLLAADGSVDNDATLVRYAQMAIAQAGAGAQVLGASGMMDGQISHVRGALDVAGYTDVALLAYAAKYASVFYGPFREAMASPLVGDRKGYQQDPANAREGVREALLDVAEGADIVMVKPAMGYLDVLRQVRDAVDVPVAAYQVSGEYAMITAAARAGVIERDAAIEESLICIRRAGADIVLTYWAAEVAALLGSG